MNMAVRWIVLMPFALSLLVIIVTIVAPSSSPNARSAVGKVFGVLTAGLLGVGLLVGLLFSAKRSSYHEQPTEPETNSSSSPNGEIRLSEPDASPVVGVLWTRTNPDTKTKTRPAWVISPASVTSATKTVLHVGPESSQVDLQKGMNQKLLKATTDFCSTQFGPITEPLPISVNQLRTTLVAESYTETQERKVGSTGTEVPVTDQWVLVEFTPVARRMLETHWQSLVLTPRLGTAALGSGLLLTLLGLIYGYLKIDQVTAGKSRTQLNFAIGAVILVMCGGGMLMLIG